MTSSVRCGPLGVIRYTSLRDENRSMSAMPRKRRLAVRATSVAMGQQRTPTVHNGQEGLLNQRGDLCGGLEVQSIRDYAVFVTPQNSGMPDAGARPLTSHLCHAPGLRLAEKLELKPCAPRSRHGCRLKALGGAAAESWPAAPAMDLRPWTLLLALVPWNDECADRFSDFADPFDSRCAAKILPKLRPSSAKSAASS